MPFPLGELESADRGVFGKDVNLQSLECDCARV